MVAPVPSQISKLPHRLPAATRHVFPLRSRHSNLPTFGRFDALLSPLCFHILTNCFSRNPFILITIRIAPGCHPSAIPTFKRLDPQTCQLFCLQKLAASFASPKKSTPLQSNKSSLFLQKTPGGVCATVPSFKPSDPPRRRTLTHEPSPSTFVLRRLESILYPQSYCSWTPSRIHSFFDQEDSL